MWCLKCDKDLRECECPDLPERIAACTNVIFSPEVKKQAERVQGMNELKTIGEKPNK